MALDTYANLKTELQNYLARTDTTITERLDTFIDLTEELVNTRVRHPRMLSSATITTVAGTETASLPSDFLQIYNLSHNVGTLNIDYASVKTIQDKLGGSSSGKPYLYGIQSSEKLIFAPTPDGAYNLNLEYYAKVPPLSGAQTTNWLLTNFPSIYLNGCLLQAYKFLRDDNGIARTNDLFIEAIKRVEEDALQWAAGGSGMYIKPEARTTAGRRN